MNALGPSFTRFRQPRRLDLAGFAADFTAVATANIHLKADEDQLADLLWRWPLHREKKI